MTYSDSCHPGTRPAGSLRLSDRKSTRLNSSHVRMSYAVFCLKKKIELDDGGRRAGRGGAFAQITVPAGPGYVGSGVFSRHTLPRLCTAVLADQPELDVTRQRY